MAARKQWGNLVLALVTGAFFTCIVNASDKVSTGSTSMATVQHQAGAPKVPDGLSLLQVDSSCRVELPGGELLPLVKRGRWCQLTQDLTLHKWTLALATDVWMDGGDFTLKAGADSAPSVPLLALNVSGTRIENFIISGFDFGVIYANAYDNRFANNKVKASYHGVLLINSSANRIDHVDALVMHPAGSTLTILGDSDDNRVDHNCLVVLGGGFPSDNLKEIIAANGAAPITPGTPAVYLFAASISVGNPTVWLQRSNGLRNLFVDGEIVQFRWEPGQLTERTLIEYNVIDSIHAVPGFLGLPTGIILIEGNSEAKILSNTIASPGKSLVKLRHYGGMPVVGSCQGKPELLCLDINEMSSEVRDAYTAMGQSDMCFGFGPCEGAEIHVIAAEDSNALSYNTVIRNNIISPGDAGSLHPGSGTPSPAVVPELCLPEFMRPIEE